MPTLSIALIILLILSAGVDLKTKTIPNIFPIFVLALAPLNPNWTISSALLGVLVLGGALLLPATFQHLAFGGGDIKLVSALAYVLGYQVALTGLFIAVSVSLPFCIYYHFAKKETTIPFAPFIAYGYIGAILFA